MRWTRRPSEEIPAEGGDRKGGGVIRFMLTVAILAWALRSFLVAPFNIPSGSMLPTLYIGDYLLVAKWPYGYSRVSFPFGFPSFDGRILSDLPERGDVAVFRHPTENSDLIKRVIALPGDRIEVRGGRVVLNGRLVERVQAGRFAMPISPNSECKVVPPASAFVQNRGGSSYCLYPAFLESLAGGPSYTVLDQIDTARADDFPQVTVPDGQIFLMGDNRDDSLDSRYSTIEGGIGFVPVENLVGRGLVTFWSTNGSAVYWKPWTWFTALRANRIGNGYEGAAE
jgi:signal peptidase I